MKGCRCTPAQIASANAFLEIAKWAPSDERANVRRADIVRLVAWYGALRYIAGQSGEGGTLEQPGPLVGRRRRRGTGLSHTANRRDA